MESIDKIIPSIRKKLEKINISTIKAIDSNKLFQDMWRHVCEAKICEIQTMISCYRNTYGPVNHIIVGRDYHTRFVSELIFGAEGVNPEVEIKCVQAHIRLNGAEIPITIDRFALKKVLEYSPDIVKSRLNSLHNFESAYWKPMLALLEPYGFEEIELTKIFNILSGINN